MSDEQRLGLPEEPTPLLIDCAATATCTTCEECSKKHGGCGSYPQAKAWGAAWREKALELEKEREELCAELDELAIAIGFGERPEGQVGIHRASGKEIARRTVEVEKERDELLDYKESVRLALDEYCSCGGGGPDDCCDVCRVWHAVNCDCGDLCP